MLIGELADALHLSGFEHGLFQSVGTTITAQLTTNIYGVLTGAVHTDPLHTPWALTDGFDPASLATSITGAVGAYFGSYLASQIVTARSAARSAPRPALGAPRTGPLQKRNGPLRSCNEANGRIPQCVQCVHILAVLFWGCRNPDLLLSSKSRVRIASAS